MLNCHSIECISLPKKPRQNAIPFHLNKIIHSISIKITLFARKFAKETFSSK